jgi:S1-C subfamily serine protease
LRSIFLISVLLTTATVAADPRDLFMAQLVSGVTAATVRVDSASELSSGVIISREGYVLTVAHGLSENELQVTVKFSDGTSAKADVVYRNSKRDVALLRVVDASQRKFVAVSLGTKKVTDNATVLAFGYPAREKQTATPVVRLGKLTGSYAKNIRSSCVLTAGDSGGPLVSTGGELLGIHQRIGVDRTTNLHLSIDECCAALLDSIDLRRLPLLGWPSKSPGQLSVMAKDIWQHRAVEILKAKHQVTAWGTVMNSHTVVTKLSLLKPNTKFQVRTLNGDMHACELVAENRSVDIAVLLLSVAIDVESIGLDASARLRIGHLVYGNEAGEPGIIARIDHTEPAARPRLGCTLKSVNDGLVIEQVSPDSAAADGSLQPTDELRVLSSAKTLQLADVAVAVEQHQPGDWVQFLFRRAGVDQTSFGQLRHEPSEMLDRSEFLDGRSGELSLRRSSFSHTLQHDLPLTPQQMGGPLLSAEGKVIGVNIARRAREAVLAIPIEVLLSTCPEISR